MMCEPMLEGHFIFYVGIMQLLSGYDVSLLIDLTKLPAEEDQKGKLRNFKISWSFGFLLLLASRWSIHNNCQLFLGHL